MDIIYLIAGFLIAYILGSIPTAVWIGQWFYGIDVRKKGSGNAGATNTIRVLGWNAGVPVFLLDIFKGFFAVWIMLFFIPAGWDNDLKIYIQILAGIFAVTGHALPVFAGFKGGKGVATLFGAGIALYGWAILVPLFVFLIVIAITKYVSLGSILGAISFPIAVIFIFQITHPGLIGLAVFAAMFILWTHRKNIVRLLKGEENRFSFTKKDKS